MMTTEELIRGFSEEGLAEWCRGAFADFVPASKSLAAGDFVRARQIGYVRTLADGELNRPLLVAAVQVPGELGERSSRKRQFDFARKALQRAMDAPPGKVEGLFAQGVFVFYGDGGDFRMSLVTGRVEGGKLAYNSFKRQTFFVRQDQVNRTFRDQMGKGIGDYPALCVAFSIEALTKQFYKELFAWYEWALSKGVGVTFPNDIFDGKDDCDLNAEHMIRLIARLMFVWFIKQKYLVPKEIFEIDALEKMLKKFDPQSKTQDNYYRAILQNLFFATLNKKIEERKFSIATGRVKNDYTQKPLYRYKDEFTITEQQVLKLFERVPFLNGGLFECLDNLPGQERDYFDGFSRVKSKQAHVPNFLFFHKDRSGDPDKDRGLIPLFSRYNFTVEENSPNDAEVALDPELLGKVFENLLASYNPETQETARNQSGSFYTPREIVNYMVDESLKRYLKAQVSGVDDAALDQLFGSEGEKSGLPTKMQKELAEAIRAAKILDPACGSGAFPMGALHRMVDLLTKLEHKPEDIYALKFHLIEECIYGVDIQTIAVQISKLRFFISLVCEQKPNKDKANNYGIRALPNLETRFVAANTLLGLKKQEAQTLDLDDAKLRDFSNELWEVRHKHFSANYQEKLALRSRDGELRKAIQKRIIELAPKPDPAVIARMQAQIRGLQTEREKFNAQHWVERPVSQMALFGEDGSGAAPTMERVDINKEHRKKIDQDIRNCERVIENELGKANHKKLEQLAAQLAMWDPYNQNKPSDFFDAKWMFNVGDGFDVVIGNPPYIQLQSNQGQLSELYENQKFQTFDRTGDIYCLFYERGWTLLKEGGHLCFITSNSWMRTSYGGATRKFLKTKATPRLLIDFAGQQIFEAATVETNILLFARGTGTGPTQACEVRAHHMDDFVAYVRKNSVPCLFPSDGSSWVILSPIQQQIKAKVDRIGTPLKNWKIQINFGIKTGLNKAFIIDSDQKDELVAADAKSLEILRPILRGRDVKRYGFDFADKWLINTHNGQKKTGTKRVKVDNFPAIKAFLLKFKTALIKRSDKGDTPFHLRDCAYLDELAMPKIVWGEISDKAKFAYDLNGDYIAEATTFFMTGESLPYLFCYLNSKLSEYLFSQIGTTTGMGTVRWKKYTIEQLFVPRNVDQEPFNQLAKKIIKGRERGQNTSGFEAEVDRLVYGLYGLTKEEITVVESTLARDAVLKKVKQCSPFADAEGEKSVLVDDEGLD